MNKIHERAFRSVYKYTRPDCEAVLKLNNVVSVHQRNLQYLMTEIYKTKNSLNPSLMRELFKPSTDLQYNLRNNNTLEIPEVRTTSYGIETVQFFGQKLWQMLPPNVRESLSLIALKKEWREKILISCTIKCDCSLCKTFISRFGFI